MCNVIATKNKNNNYTSNAPTPKTKPRCVKNNNYYAIFDDNDYNEQNEAETHQPTPLQNTEC